MTEWVKGASPSVLAERLESSRLSSGAFDGTFHQEHALVLAGMLTFSAQIPVIERHRIASRATFDAAKAGKITPNSLKKHCDLLESAYLRQPIRSYRLVSGLSIQRSAVIPSIRFGSVTISFSPKLSAKLRGSRSELHRRAFMALNSDAPTNYLEISARVQSKSAHSAAQKAFDAIDMIRALWNLAVNLNVISRSSNGLFKPVNAIRLFPFHTLHHIDGSLASDSWWFDPAYTGPVSVFSEMRKLPQLLQFDKKVRQKLAASAYKGEIEQSLLRYVRALDSTDLSDAFLRLWGVLEQLTGTTKSSYEVTIRRAAFLFQERDYAHQVLAVLCSYRNGFIHAGSENPDIEAYVFILKRHVESLLLFHLNNRFGFSSLSDAGEFLDLPATRGVLAERLTRLRNAYKFVSGA